MNAKNKMHIIQPIMPTAKLSYEDIMRNMGIRQNNGKLEFLGNQQHELNQPNKSDQKEDPNKYIHNSYIYNKYFKDHIKNNELTNTPQNIFEYRNMLIKQIINNYKAKQLKNGKIKVPIDTNINYNLTYKQENKLFDFSKRL